jgi:hypothetical protein
MSRLSASKIIENHLLDDEENSDIETNSDYENEDIESDEIEVDDFNFTINNNSIQPLHLNQQSNNIDSSFVEGVIDFEAYSARINSNSIYQQSTFFMNSNQSASTFESTNSINMNELMFTGKNQ